MSTGKIIGIVVFVVIVLFALFLFQTIKTKSTSLNNFVPYKELIGKTVVLNNDVILYKYKNSAEVFNSNYPYFLIDSKDPDWISIPNFVEINEIETIFEIPKGASLKIEKAIQYTNGVSGTSSPFVFGTITSDDIDYKVSYQWGEQNMSKNFDNIPESWYFYQAPWQNELDTSFYYLPKAKIW